MTTNTRRFDLVLLVIALFSIAALSLGQRCSDRPLTYCGELPLSGSVRGAINESESCYYSFNITGYETRATLWTCPANFDTYLCLMDSDFNHIVDDDDNRAACPENRFASLIKKVLQPGSYYVAVSAFANGRGIYNLSTSAEVGPFPAPTPDPNAKPVCNHRNATYCGSLNTFNSTVDGSLLGEAQACYYTLAVPSTQTITTYLCPADFDTYMCLLDSSMETVAYNDDSRDACATNRMASRITATLDEGEYYVVVSAWEQLFGNFTLHATNETVPSPSPIPTPTPTPVYGPVCNGRVATNCGTLPANGSVTGSLSPLGACYYSLDLTQQSNITFNTCPATVDSYLCLYDVNMNQIDSNDDSDNACAGNDYASRLDENLAAGRYYVAVSAYAWSFGSYQLNVLNETVPIPSPTPLPSVAPSSGIVCANRTAVFCGNLTFPASHNGSLPDGLSACYYSFEVSDDAVSANVTFNICPANFDTHICLFDEDLNLVDENDDHIGAYWSCPHAPHAPYISDILSPGRYHVAVAGARANYGSYQLNGNYQPGEISPTPAPSQNPSPSVSPSPYATPSTSPSPSSLPSTSPAVSMSPSVTATLAPSATSTAAPSPSDFEATTNPSPSGSQSPTHSKATVVISILFAVGVVAIIGVVIFTIWRRNRNARRYGHLEGVH